MVRAVICRELANSEALVLEDVEARQTGAGEVSIAVKAAGLNFPDLLMVDGKYQLKHPLPFTPGMEASGVVDAVGKGVTSFRPGDRVMVRQWKNCLAEQLVVPADEVQALPEGFTFEEGATFLLATSTSTNAVMQRGQLRAGEFLLVHGAGGGVGLAAVEIGKLLGARVIATASSAEKLAVARERGAEFTINYAETDFAEEVMKVTDGHGADVIFDPVGGDVFDKSLKCIAWGGRLLIVGFAGGRIAEVKTNRILLKCCSLIGVRAVEHIKHKPEDGAAYLNQMHEWAGKGYLRPHISHRLPLEKYKEAMNLLHTRSAIGRVVVVMDGATD